MIHRKSAHGPKVLGSPIPAVGGKRVHHGNRERRSQDARVTRPLSRPPASPVVTFRSVRERQEMGVGKEHARCSPAWAASRTLATREPIDLS